MPTWEPREWVALTDHAKQPPRPCRSGHIARRGGKLERRPEPLAASGGEHVEVNVCRDAVQACLQRGPPCEPVHADSGAEHRLLHRVLGVDDGAEHAATVACELPHWPNRPRISCRDRLDHAGPVTNRWPVPGSFMRWLDVRAAMSCPRAHVHPEVGFDPVVPGYNTLPRKEKAPQPNPLQGHDLASGADRDRTGDPLLAKQVLSQLSYRP